MTESPQTPQPQQESQPQQAGGGGGQQQGNGIAIAGMVLGIISVATCWIWCFPWIAIACGIVGVILSVLGLKTAKERGGLNAGKAKTGLICGLIGLAVSVVLFIVVLAFFTAATSSLSQQMQQMTEEMERGMREYQNGMN